MSGLYPDVPGPRMAFHRDGSKWLNIPTSSGIIRERSVAEMQAINDEGETGWGVVQDSGGNADTHKFVIVFPELRDVVGYYLAHATNETWNPSALQSSVDTTSGNDGAWVNIGTGAVTSRANIAVSPDYRTNIIAITANGVKAIRFTCFIDAAVRTFKAWHIYGKPTTGQVRWLVLTDASDVEVTGAYFDFGDDPRGGSAETKTFKVKNGHTTSTATTITVSSSALTEKSPVFADDYTFSTDGTNFTPTIQVASLAPGVLSGTLHVRRTTPIGATLGLEAGIINAAAASWS